MPKQQIQIGVEGFKGDERVFRLTPLDIPAEVPAQVTLVVGAVESIIDTRDSQPGDGEIDVPIPVDKAAQMFPWIKPHLERVDRVQLFINFK